MAIHKVKKEVSDGKKVKREATQHQVFLLQALRNMKASAKKTGFYSATDQPENDSVDSGVFDGVRLSESTVDYKDVSSFEEFTVVINGLVIDFEFSNYVRTKYYELCRSQNSFLHERLIEGINCKLAAGVISETVNIADAVESSKSAASRECFLLWEKTLKAFEVLGMNVGFLRTRLRRLIGDPTESKLFRKVVLEKILRADEQRKNLQAKLSEVKEVATKLGSAMEALMENGEIF